MGGTHGLVVYGSASFFLNFTSSRSLPKKTISCTSVVYTTIRCCDYRTKIYRAAATALLLPPPSPPPRKPFSRRHLLSFRGPPRLLTPGLLQQPSKKVSHRRRETPDTVVTHIKNIIDSRRKSDIGTSAVFAMSQVHSATKLNK